MSLLEDRDVDDGPPGSFSYGIGAKASVPADTLINDLQPDQEETCGLFYKCPCGCGRVGYLPFRGRGRDGGQRPSWTWDGNKEKPTLAPSIHSDKAKGGCGWHGHLTAGIFKSV